MEALGAVRTFLVYVRDDLIYIIPCFSLASSEKVAYFDAVRSFY